MLHSHHADGGNGKESHGVTFECSHDRDGYITVELLL